MATVKEIAAAIESFAPLGLQQNYDNAGLQVGNPDMKVSAILLCLDVTEEILAEAIERECNMIVSHHPLIFTPVKHLTGSTPTERIIERAIRNDISIYSAHTNLDSAFEGVSYEIGHLLGVKDMKPLVQETEDPKVGLGVEGNIKPTPRMEFIRRLKEIFEVKDIRFSALTPGIVVRKVAICSGSGASFIRQAIAAGADAYVTGDLKYHDYTSFGDRILMVDIGHHESELCSREILSRAIREKHPEMVTYFPESETNPIGVL